MRAADADILIVPGWSDSGPEHWQTRWQAKLSTARRVTQRDFEKPIRAEWEETIAQEVLASARPAVIVAHSLGVIAALHAAQRVGDKIAGAFLVAPPSEAVIREMPSVDSAFLPIPRAKLPVPCGAGRQQRRSLRRSALCAPSRAGYRRALHRRRRRRPHQCRQRPRAVAGGLARLRQFHGEALTRVISSEY